MTQGPPPANVQADFPWPLTFDEFSFGTRVFNTLSCSIIFADHQFALDDELDQQTPPPPPNWQDRWGASYIVADYMLPAGPVVIQWTSLDGVARHVEIDLVNDIFPEREVLHNVPKEDINEDWVRYECGKTSSPDILMEVNDRTINIYMKEMVLTKLPPRPERPDILFRSDLVLAWTKTY